MGCGSSLQDGPAAKPNTEKKATTTQAQTSDKSIKAALLIQRWYRRYLARLEVRRRNTWKIFQSLEYAGEQDQLRLYNFFNDLMIQLKEVQREGKDPSQDLLTAQVVTAPQHVRAQSVDEEDTEVMFSTDPSTVEVPATYRGPRIKLPITSNQVDQLISAFKKKQILHARYVLEILHEVRKFLKDMPNISKATANGPGKQITVCGDLHGKLGDLLTIFYKNGLPDDNNPYVFNGDFVDRGPYSVEITVLLFCFILLNPRSVYLNRGNHEDYIVNFRYGLTKEIVAKYKEHAKKVRHLFEDVFSWLPLATVIDNQVLVAHGGISSVTNLQELEAINRHRYLSVLKPLFIDDDENKGIDKAEWRQILDLLWSDPMKQNGCIPNKLRNGGVLWGPNVTANFLKKYRMKLLIRSHECKQEGYEFTHDNKVLTIFSASNYYDLGSNKGAYVKLGPDLKPRIIQFIVTKESQKRLTIRQRVGNIETSAMKVLKTKLRAHKIELTAEFEKYDPNGTGGIKPSEWCDSVTHILQMELAWWSMHGKLGLVTRSNGMVDYQSTFKEMELKSSVRSKGQSGVSEALYRNKDSLEAIFRAIDKDNSGYISMTEFADACKLLEGHTKSQMDKSEIMAMARNLDLNKDGRIDFNEFLEAFRIVDKFGQELERRRMSEDSVNLLSDNGE